MLHCIPPGIISFTTGYIIEGSGLFDGSSGFLSRTPDDAGNVDKFTLEFILKRSKLGSTSQTLFEAGSDTNNRTNISYRGGGGVEDRLQMFQLTSGSIVWELETTAEFRDVSAYLHYVVAFDTTQSTAANRIKIYVNGTQTTDLSVSTYPSSGLDTYINTTNVHRVGSLAASAGTFLNAYVARVALIDGLQLAPTSFGEVTDDGFWQINDASELTFGNNGFLIEGGTNVSTGTDSQAGGTATEAETSLLIHFDGNDAATTSTDSSSYSHTPTFVGNAQLDTAQKKFGTSSLLLDGNGDYVTIPDHPSLELGTGNFTISFQVYFNTIHTKDATFTNNIMGKYTGSSVGWLLTYANGTHLTFYSGAAGAVLSTEFSLSTGQWYHMEISRSGTAVKWFVNGVERSSATSSVNLNGPSKLLWIGVESTTYQATDRDLDGFIDEVKIIKGSAAHTSGFTAPSAAHTDPATANHFTKVGTITATNDSPTNGDDS